ncbi:MAG: pyrroline-5-carboxylate reductase [Coriobacteriia bacterium]|nr:pyrroline-5-carboxylate reductase [Coriobacteriia bacterium]
MILKGPLAVIGGGRMGEAIIGGLLAAGSFDRASIVVAEPDPVRRAALTESHGVRCVAEGREAVAGAATVLLAVKPQILGSVVDALADAVPSDAVVVSIAAGISTTRIESMLAAGAAVVRVMPNTPALVRQGMAVVSGGVAATTEDVEAVRDLFGAVGQTIVIDECLQDAATAISGSGPAYVAILVEELTRAGVAHGLSPEVAQGLAVQTLRGTAELLDRTGQHPADLVRAVSSPGGTTVAAIEQLESGGFRTSIGSAVAAAVTRAKELGST